MSTAWYLVIAFTLLNVLDGFTTWLGLYHLPPELRAKESNVLLRTVIEKSFLLGMFWKLTLVIIGLWGLLYLIRVSSVDLVFALIVLNGVLLIAILNNLGVYLSRLITKKKVRSPVEHMSGLLRRCRLPERLARILSFYVLFGVITIVVYIITKAAL
jgi:hypothetical protein